MSATPAGRGTSEDDTDVVDEAAPIHAVRIGCALHILHLAVMAGIQSDYFMGTMGSGSWHEWKTAHLVALLGTVWYTISRSGSSTANFAQFNNLVGEEFEVTWKSKFPKPTETRWAVVWQAAAILDSRWDEVQWLFTVWAAGRLFSGPFRQYWMQGAFMMLDPSFRLQAKFAKALGDKILNWAFNWLRGRGGYFLQRGDVMQQLHPGMRLAEIADFSLEFIRRMKELQRNPDVYFEEELAFAKQHLGARGVSVDFAACFPESMSIFEG